MATPALVFVFWLLTQLNLDAVEKTGLNLVGDAINPLVSLIAIVIAGLSWRTALELRRTEEKNLLHSTAYNVLLAEFRDRKFVSTRRWLGGSTKPKYLHEAKFWARKQIGGINGGWDKLAQEKWDMKAELIGENCESDIAGAVGDSLQHLGLLAFTGGLPLKQSLASASVGIVSDWLLFAAWMKSYHKKMNVKKSRSAKTVYFHRRHAEWFALIALAHLRRQEWNIDEIYPSNHHLMTEPMLSDRIRFLTEIDAWASHEDVRQEVKELTGISL